MKLILRILLWVVVIVIVLILSLILLLFILSGRPFVPGNYTEKVKTGGTLEEKYMHMGPYETAVYTEEAPEDWGNYIIHYPKEMEYSNKTYPLVVFVNGTGVKASTYPALLEHLASWGFIVIGNEDTSTFSGDSANASIAFLLEQNEERNSLFYHKVDIAHIGISGHSQGGVGVFNALKDETYGKLYTCAVSLSPTEMELAEALHIPYNPEGITTPTMVIASEEHDVITKDGIHAIDALLEGPHISAMRINADHGKMLYEGDGYVTAWLMYWLKEDKEAGSLFSADSEWYNNPLWKEVHMHVSI